jgi:hypothetical protein
MMASYVLCCLLTCAGLVSPPLPGSFPTTTTTKTGLPGDPVNLVLIGSREELVGAFRAAGWSVADPITVRSALRIGVSVALNRSYPAAPVSDLFLFGRTQDVAFERSVGPSARTRHHVRFWQAATCIDGRAVWVGSGTFDVRVGRSPATGRLTHRISPDVDAERDFITTSLEQSGGLVSVSRQAGGGPAVGRNGEGDCYFTDGNVATGVLTQRTEVLVECGTCRLPRSARR